MRGLSRDPYERQIDFIFEFAGKEIWLKALWKTSIFLDHYYYIRIHEVSDNLIIYDKMPSYLAECYYDDGSGMVSPDEAESGLREFYKTNIAENIIDFTSTFYICDPLEALYTEEVEEAVGADL